MGKTVIVDIKNSQFGPATIAPDTYVVWRNLDPYPHSAETPPGSPFYFNAGALLPGETSSPVYFSSPGRHQYLCRFHADMTGVVSVGEVADESGHHGDSHHHHLKHFHGFVTGGKSAQRLFMTHTPVIADPRHRYQVILQGSTTETAHGEAYEAIRNSNYGSGKIQIFHDHLSLVDIDAGVVNTLPEASFEYYPDGPTGMPIPGLENAIPVRIDKVIHFHEFDPDSDYPDGLAYLLYGDSDDVFIDHYITRAPNYHSVAKLAKVPDFWTADNIGHAVHILIPSKRIRDVSPKLLTRVAFVDNRFHLFWLPPPGVYAPQPQDPLRPPDGGTATFEVELDEGTRSTIEIAEWLHFDVRLLNYGVLIV